MVAVGRRRLYNLSEEDYGEADYVKVSEKKKIVDGRMETANFGSDVNTL